MDSPISIKNKVVTCFGHPTLDFKEPLMNNGHRDDGLFFCLEIDSEVQYC